MGYWKYAGTTKKTKGKRTKKGVVEGDKREREKDKRKEYYKEV